MRNIVQGSIITTFRCNAKCHMCDFYKHPTKASEEISPKLLEKLPEGLRINITGGEPTIRKDIDDIFEVLYDKSHLLELSTNGYFTDSNRGRTSDYKFISYAKLIQSCIENGSIVGKETKDFE